jgi:hypothetical protein
MSGTSPGAVALADRWRPPPEFGPCTACTFCRRPLFAWEHGRGFCREYECRERSWWRGSGDTQQERVRWWIRRSPPRAATKRRLVERDGYACRCCGVSDLSLCIDHVLPRSRGGRRGVENAQLLCHRCNASKSAGAACRVHGRVAAP